MIDTVNYRVFLLQKNHAVDKVDKTKPLFHGLIRRSLKLYQLESTSHTVCAMTDVASTLHLLFSTKKIPNNSHPENIFPALIAAAGICACCSIISKDFPFTFLMATERIVIAKREKMKNSEIRIEVKSSLVDDTKLGGIEILSES